MEMDERHGRMKRNRWRQMRQEEKVKRFNFFHFDERSEFNLKLWILTFKRALQLQFTWSVNASCTKSSLRQSVKASCSASSLSWSVKVSPLIWGQAEEAGGPPSSCFCDVTAESFTRTRPNICLVFESKQLHVSLIWAPDVPPQIFWRLLAPVISVWLTDVAVGADWNTELRLWSNSRNKPRQKDWIWRRWRFMTIIIIIHYDFISSFRVCEIHQLGRNVETLSV